MYTRFEWDPDKDGLNRRKHGVGFDLAMRVFSDPLAMSRQDRIEDGEMRWQTIGMVDGLVMLVVAHTYRDDLDAGPPVEIIRIISARRADRSERRRYEEDSD